MTGPSSNPRGEHAPRSAVSRPSASTITDDQLDALYDDRDELRAERDHSDEAARRILDQHQQLASERYVWQERVFAARCLHGRDDSNPHGPWCNTCLTAWPCATAVALGEPEQPDHVAGPPTTARPAACCPPRRCPPSSAPDRQGAIVTAICRHPLRIVTHNPKWLSCDIHQAAFTHEEDCPGVGTPGCASECMQGADPVTASLDALFAAPAAEQADR